MSTPAEIPLKLWVQQVAERANISVKCQWARLYRGALPQPIITRKVNARVIFVQPLSP